MGPKKKKGGKKAEKAKPMDEAEMLAADQLNNKNNLRRKLEDETKISKVNSLKITNQWRKIMRIAKSEALKKDIEILSQNHERDVDRKDAILQMLDRDLEEAEDQYQMALRTHLMNLDTLINLHESRLFALEKNFQDELKKKREIFLKENNIIIKKLNLEKKNLLSIINTIENEEENKNNDIKHIYEQTREEIRNKNLEDINMLRISLDAQIEELEQFFETSHLNYLQMTSQKTHDFKELTINDQKLTNEIEKRRKKIDNLQTTIQHWKAKSRQLNRETEERNRLLLEEKMSIQKHYQQLKQRIKVYRTSQNQRLLQLSQSANNCKKVLQDKLNAARRVLQLQELLRNMETIFEQVLPFTSNTQEIQLNNNENEEIIYKNNTMDSLALIANNEIEKNNSKNNNPSAQNQTPNNLLTNNYVPHQTSMWDLSSHKFVNFSDRLNKFYKKYNKILLDNIIISKEKEKLLLENEQLESLIKQYLDGFTITNELFSDDNPLIIVNGRANLNKPLPVKRVNKNGKTVKQDAFVIANTVNKQLNA